MKFLIRGLFLFVLVIGLVLGFFSLYAHFLMDYSLDSLAMVSSSAQDNAHSEKNFSVVSQNTYRSVVDDMAVEEVSSDNLNLENLVYLDLASRSLDEAKYRAGFARAHIYLEKVIDSKRPERPVFLIFMDGLTKGTLQWVESVYSFVKYALNKLFNKPVSQKIELEDYASALLLNQAQDKEQQGMLSQSEELYRKFLDRYKSSANRAVATVSLGNILIREKKFSEASKFLSKAQAEFYGSSESYLIQKLLNRLVRIQEKLDLIQKLKAEMNSQSDNSQRQKLFLKLGIAYMGTYQMEKAESIFLKLSALKDKDIRQKAGFYLGWIYKMNSDYDKSAEALSRLLQDPELEAAMELGLRAQLADVYYKKGNAKASAQQYQIISAKSETQKKEGTAKASQLAWTSFSELELVNIYSFDLKNSKEAREHLDKLSNLAEENTDYRSLDLILERAGKITLRDLAFQALVEKRVTRALDFFTKYLSGHPDDGLTLTGLATVYALMGDLDNAYLYAQRGFERYSTEYSMLMLGYIESLRGDYQAAINRYRQALSLTPNSTSAKFNLSYVYLKTEEYKKSLDIMVPLEKEVSGIADKVFLRAKILNNIGYCYWGMDEHPRDLEFFQKAVDLNPDFEIAKQNIKEVKGLAAPQAAKLLD